MKRWIKMGLLEIFMLRKPKEFLTEKQWKTKANFLEMHGFQQNVRKQNIKNMPGVGPK